MNGMMRAHTFEAIQGSGLPTRMNLRLGVPGRRKYASYSLNSFQGSCRRDYTGGVFIGVSKGDSRILDYISFRIGTFRAIVLPTF